MRRVPSSVETDDIRNGPMVEYAHPPLPYKELPEAWSFMPFMCLPDGAHLATEEFIYFHLPPAPGSLSTTFGLACFRQIDASELLNKTADVTRTKVQKAVVVLASKPILGCVRSKLGLVTQAFFAQLDFSKLDILDVLYSSLTVLIREPVTEALMHSGLSVREMVAKFKHKTLTLFKALLLGKRIIFFGSKVERLCAYQYALISLVPELITHLPDTGAPELGYDDVVTPNELKLPRRPSERRVRVSGFPLRLFGKGRFVQPYIPLQQMDILLSPNTLSFMVGTTNAIFTQHKGVGADLVVNCDTGMIETLKQETIPQLSSSTADKKFMDDITKSVMSTWVADDDMSMNQSIQFEGSDDDIRARFEQYLTQLLMTQLLEEQPHEEPVDAPKRPDYLADFNTLFVKSWEQTSAYQYWRNQEHELDGVVPGHPCHGYSPLGAAQQQVAAKLAEWGKNIQPMQSSLSRAFASKESSPHPPEPTETSNSAIPGQNIQTSASQLMSNMSSWYSNKKKEWGSSSQPATSPDSQIQSPDSANGLMPPPQ